MPAIALGLQEAEGVFATRLFGGVYAVATQSVDCAGGQNGRANGIAKAAIGTGNVGPGCVTASLGTSGTIFACSNRPVVDPEGEIAAFCDSNDRWLPLLCTMNVTVTR